LDDGALAVARRGPAVDTLRDFAGGRPCDLGNIEVYYRMGLAHHAQGNFDDALAAFEAVNDVSPGYRDAWKRVEDLRGWKDALAGATRLGADDEPAGNERYELRGELGRGRIAVVYRAHDHRLRRDVALKLLSEALSGQRTVRELFEQRAHAAAALAHPNLVTIHDTGVLAGRAFVAMELVDGPTVATLVREPGGLPIVESLRIMKQVLDALATLHGHRLVHHDVRPGNIMRTASGVVKLLEPAILVPRAEGPPAVLGAVPGYLAPELLAGSRGGAGAAELDQQADVFSAAVTLFELLSGKLPYHGGDRASPPVRLASLAAAVPAPLEAAIMRGVAAERDQRWRFAAELGSRVGAILRAVQAYVASARPAPSPPQ
ncbi:MAG TPA: protein kinase, partial [Kofleriaceae bacterium]|nr:protein kinase [Kofleriaceae bacterium]